MRLLPLALVAALASCSVQLDSQYGIRLEPHSRGPRSDAHAAEAGRAREADATASADAAGATLTSPLSPALAAPWTDPAAPLAFSADAPAASAGMGASELSLGEPIVATANSAPTELDQAETASVPDADRDEWPTQKPDRSMTVAWILWGTVAFLTLFAAGGLGLNFGAHWYYLGQKRKGMRRTVIWALTLVAFSIVYLFSKIAALRLLALLLGIFVLFPLIVIQIIGLVKDFFALQKIGAKKARRAQRGPSDRSKKFSI